jgi:hypothetical protein
MPPTRLSSRRPLAICLVLLCGLSASIARAQSASTPPVPVPPTAAPLSASVPPDETVSQLRERLSPGQRQQLDDALAAYQANRYADALPVLNQLRDRHPRDPILAKFVAEASLNTGDAASAITALKPLAAAATSDWQASALLARACAESGDAPCRDAAMAHMLALHTQGLIPASVKDYPLEHVKVGTNTLIIFSSLEPWGGYKICALGEVRNADGKLLLTTTIESNDADQPGFAKEHPKQAEQSMRRFSLDAYAETGLNAAGQRTQTHYTFAFFDGQPSYDTIHENFVKIASGKSSALSSRTGLIVP